MKNCVMSTLCLFALYEFDSGAICQVVLIFRKGLNERFTGRVGRKAGRQNRRYEEVCLHNFFRCFMHTTKYFRCRSTIQFSSCFDRTLPDFESRLFKLFGTP